MGVIAAMQYGNPDMPSIIESYDRRRQYSMKRLVELGFETPEPFGAFYIMPKVTAFESDAEYLFGKIDGATRSRCGSGFGFCDLIE